MLHKIRNENILVYVLSLYVVPCIFLSSFMIVEIKYISLSFNLLAQDFHIRTLIYFTCLPISMRYFGYVLQGKNIKVFLYWGVVVFAISNILSALTELWYLFLFFQAVNSMADGLIVVCIALFFKLFVTKNNLGQIYGIHGAIISFSSATALSIGSIISYYLGWREVFFILSVVSLLVLWLFHKFIPSNIQHATSLGEKDFLSKSSVKFLAFTFLILSINFIILQIDVPYFFRVSLLLICCLLLVLIITFDQIFEVKFSIIPKIVFHSYEYSSITLIVLLVFLPINIYFTFLPTYLIIKHQVSFVILGCFLAIGEMCTFLLSSFFGKKVDKCIYKILILGVFLTIVSFCIFLLCASFGEKWLNILIFTAIAIYGAALAMINPAIGKLILVSAPNQDTDGMIGFYSMIKFFTNSIAAILFNIYLSLNLMNIFLVEYYFLFSTAILCNIFLVVSVLYFKKYKL